MKTRTDYIREYARLRKECINEIREALKDFPEQEFTFMDEENTLNIEDLLVISVYDNFTGETKDIYVTKIRLDVKTDGIEILGYEKTGGGLGKQDSHYINDSACDVCDGQLPLILSHLPEPEKEVYEEVRNTYYTEGYWTIDAWRQNQEEGKVIAVINDKTAEVYVIESDAHYSPMAQKAIKEKVTEILRDGGGTLYNKKVMENAVLLAADIYKDIYESEEQGRYDKAVEKVVELEKQRQWQDNDERDYIEELERFERKALKDIRRGKE